MKKKIETLWLFAKYQIVTKLMMAIVLIPMYHLVFNWLLDLGNFTHLSSGLFKTLVTSRSGIGLIGISLLFLIMMTLFDINAFVLLTAKLQQKHQSYSIQGILVEALKKLGHYLNLPGILFILYVSVIFPIVGMGIGVAPLQHLTLPNFITSVIFTQPLLFTGYAIVLVALLIIGYGLIFSFHYTMLAGQSTFKAMHSSIKLVCQHKKRVFTQFIWYQIKLQIILAVGIFVLVVINLMINEWVEFHPIVARTLLIFQLLVLATFATIGSSLILPLLLQRLTTLYYQIAEETITSLPVIKAKPFKLRKIKHKAIGSTGFTALIMISISILSAIQFDDLFEQPQWPIVIAHRGGGYLATENSIAGIEQAIVQGADYTEIDIQRTKDGAYILNHDKTFKRLANHPQSSMDLILAEIKQLSIKDNYSLSPEGDKVATLNEVFTVAKDHIQLMIEFKGETADQQMVDDVIALIKAKQLEEQVVLLALDYSLIEYIEDTYPEFNSGYLYYFASGRPERIKGDWLMMEEAMANRHYVQQVHQANKKVAVWTINSTDSMKRFLLSEVDGIITDDLVKLKNTYQELLTRSDIERILDSFVYD